MAKFLNLGGYIGPRAQDITTDDFIELDEETATLVEAAIGEGFAVTVDLVSKEMTSEVMAELAKAREGSAYLAKKNELLKAVPSASNTLAAFVKQNQGKNK
jgi:hypothetical protein